MSIPLKIVINLIVQHFCQTFFKCSHFTAIYVISPKYQETIFICLYIQRWNPISFHISTNFVKCRLTSTNLFAFRHCQLTYEGLDNGNQLDAIDFSHTFVNFNHQLVLSKLQSFDVSSSLKSLMKFSYVIL